ncbi:hypothetical protein VTL71DRAFT_14556 [Oculimacula yallundae]|uniref:Uncharacterized protein n=1 Tax=Oculimacula yallundae TaxID=86028 RepID=A0ABR4CIT8_9HELO
MPGPVVPKLRIASNDYRHDAPGKQVTSKKPSSAFPGYTSPSMIKCICKCPFQTPVIRENRIESSLARRSAICEKHSTMTDIDD